MAASFVLILFFGKRLPERRTSGIGIAAVGICFVLSLHRRRPVDQAGQQPARRRAGRRGAGRPTPQPGRRADGTGAPTDARQAGPRRRPPPSKAERRARRRRGRRRRRAARSTSRSSRSCARSPGSRPAAIDFEVGTLLDGLSAMMLFTVTFISLLVHVYSTEYLHDDRRFTHYYAFLSLFTASMLFYVLASNTLQMLVGWELVGVCSFALIGHWWEEKTQHRRRPQGLPHQPRGRHRPDHRRDHHVLRRRRHRASTSSTSTSPRCRPAPTRTLLLVGALCLFGGVTSKSGQFPLHTWLPDAMAGPTPVSALIHAATMVVAGVYLVARLYPVFFDGPAHRHGRRSTTSPSSARSPRSSARRWPSSRTTSRRCWPTRPSASSATWSWPSASAPGPAACSTSSPTPCSRPACSSAPARSATPPTTPSTCARWVACKKTCRSRRSELHHRRRWRSPASSRSPASGRRTRSSPAPLSASTAARTLSLVFGLLTAFMTAAYMMRAYWLTFYGEYQGHGHPHESPKVMTVPLIILAAHVGRRRLRQHPQLRPAADSFATLRALRRADLRSSRPRPCPPPFNWFTGLAVGRARSWPARLLGLPVLGARQGPVQRPHRAGRRRRRRLHRVLENKYYFDYLYTDVIVGDDQGPDRRRRLLVQPERHRRGGQRRRHRRRSSAGRFVYENIDQRVVDSIVNGTGAVRRRDGPGRCAACQTGKVQQYAALLFARRRASSPASSSFVI